jgi:shikimate kinase
VKPSEIKDNMEMAIIRTDEAAKAYSLVAIAHHHSQEAADILAREALAPVLADAIFALQQVYAEVK